MKKTVHLLYRSPSELLMTKSFIIQYSPFAYLHENMPHWRCTLSTNVYSVITSINNSHFCIANTWALNAKLDFHGVWALGSVAWIPSQNKLLHMS